MADVRLIAVLALAACGPAGAQPEPAAVASGIKPPAGWQALPSVAASARTAASATGVTIDGAEAWGQPAMGCYAMWIALHGGGGGPDALTEQVLAGIAAEKIEVRDVVKPSDDGVLSLAIERKPYRGRLRARLQDGRIAALACVANEREPAACETACKALLGAVQ